uniref:NADH:ubiquinone reductase (H(+)-translocating) n=1 Tax=Pleurotus platypus TaxID=2015914 RepID=A0A2K9YPG9_9AGAR|nr:hypothetical protein [Pleurotus platypus]AUW35298.1 hypothetical protein [Pleurotus platypus]
MLLFTIILVLALLINYAATNKLLGLKLHHFCKSETLTDKVVTFILILSVLLFFTDFLRIILDYFLAAGPKFAFVNGENNNIQPIAQDPVRVFPTPLPQVWGTVGTAAAVHRIVPGNPRIKALVALGSLGVSIPITIYSMAIENPNGLTTVLRAISYFKANNKWPTETNSGKFVTSEEISKQLSSENVSKFIDSSIFDSFSLEMIMEKYIQLVFTVFKPASFEGYLDDLLGQQLLIHLLLLMSILGVLIFFSIFIFLLIFNSKKEYLLSKFNNKYLQFYIKYQYLLLKFSLIWMPVVIFIGLVQILVMTIFLITHTIPIEAFPVDPHMYILSKPVKD